jgi:hypothetical protein
MRNLVPRASGCKVDALLGRFAKLPSEWPQLTAKSILSVVNKFHGYDLPGVAGVLLPWSTGYVLGVHDTFSPRVCGGRAGIPSLLRPSRLAVADDRTTRDRGHSVNGGDEEARPLAQTRASERRSRWTSASRGQPYHPSAPRCHRHGGPARAAAASPSALVAPVGVPGTVWRRLGARLPVVGSGERQAVDLSRPVQFVSAVLRIGTLSPSLAVRACISSWASLFVRILELDRGFGGSPVPDPAY